MSHRLLAIWLQPSVLFVARFWACMEHRAHRWIISNVKWSSSTQYVDFIFRNAQLARNQSAINHHHPNNCLPWIKSLELCVERRKSAATKTNFNAKTLVPEIYAWAEICTYWVYLFLNTERSINCFFFFILFLSEFWKANSGTKCLQPDIKCKQKYVNVQWKSNNSMHRKLFDTIQHSWENFKRHTRLRVLLRRYFWISFAFVLIRVASLQFGQACALGSRTQKSGIRFCALDQVGRSTVQLASSQNDFPWKMMPICSVKVKYRYKQSTLFLSLHTNSKTNRQCVDWNSGFNLFAFKI